MLTNSPYIAAKRDLEHPPMPRDIVEWTREERRCEIAGILAAGLLRLRKRRWLAGEPVETARKTSADSTAERLEVSDETVLSVHAG
jgi:hypothetical protein